MSLLVLMIAFLAEGRWAPSGYANVYEGIEEPMRRGTSHLRYPIRKVKRFDSRHQDEDLYDLLSDLVNRAGNRKVGYYAILSRIV